MKDVIAFLLMLFVSPYVLAPVVLAVWLAVALPIYWLSGCKAVLPKELRCVM